MSLSLRPMPANAVMTPRMMTPRMAPTLSPRMTPRTIGPPRPGSYVAAVRPMAYAPQRTQSWAPPVMARPVASVTLPIARPSYVAPPMAQPVSYAPPMAMPVSYAPPMMVAPQSPVMVAAQPVPFADPNQPLEAMPDPQTIARQKDGYMKALDDEFNQGSNSLSQQIQARKQMLTDMANQRKAEYHAQMEAQVASQTLALDQQYNQQLMMLQQQAAQQKSVLEQQALKLTMEYQQTANAQQMQQQQAAMQQQQAMLMQQQQEEMARLAVQQSQLAGEYYALSGGVPGPMPVSYGAPVAMMPSTPPMTAAYFP